VAADRAHYTLPVGVARLVSVADTTDFGLAMAGAVLTFIPLLITFLIAEQSIIRGLAQAASE